MLTYENIKNEYISNFCSLKNEHIPEISTGFDVYLQDPSGFDVARIGATIAASATGGPAAAMAVNAAFSVVDVADGTMELKHALVQTAVSGAAGGVGAAYGSYASQAVMMAASGIDYKEGGGIGWNKDNLKAGIKSGVVSMALNYATQSFVQSGALNQHVATGLTTAATSSLDFDTNKWWKVGLNDDNDWGDSLAMGAAAGIASWAAGDTQSKIDKGNDYSGTGSLGHYTNKLISNSVENGLMAMYNMGRHDMNFEQAMAKTNFWKSLQYDHRDVGGYLGYQTADWLSGGKISDRDKAGREKAAKEKAAKEKAEREGKPYDDGNPYNNGKNWIEALGWGFRKMADDIEALGETIKDGAERVKYLFKNIFTGDGLHWENGLERADRLVLETLGNGQTKVLEPSTQQGQSAEQLKEAAVHLQRVKKQKSWEGGEYSEAEIKDATDPSNAIQSSDGPIKRDLENLFNDMTENPDDYTFDKRLAEAKELYETQLEKKTIQLGQVRAISKWSKDREPLQKEVAELVAKINGLQLREDRFNSLKEYIKNSDPTKLADLTKSATCCIQSYQMYGNATNKDTRDFKTFYMMELQRGNIAKGSSGGIVVGVGSNRWRDIYDMETVLYDTKQKGTYKQNGKDKSYAIYNSVKPSDVEALNASGKKFAIINWNNKEKKLSATDTRGNAKRGFHFNVIYKNKRNNWINMNHNGYRRGREVDWNKVYGLYY